MSCCTVREVEIGIDDSVVTRVRGCPEGNKFAEKGDLSPFCSEVKKNQCFKGAF